MISDVLTVHVAWFLTGMALWFITAVFRVIFNLGMDMFFGFLGTLLPMKPRKSNWIERNLMEDARGVFVGCLISGTLTTVVFSLVF